MRPWLPPSGQIARIGELRSLVVTHAGRCALWRGGRLFPLPNGVTSSKSFAEFEGGHRLPVPGVRFYLGAHHTGRQLYIVPAVAAQNVVAGHGSGPAAHLLKEFLGTPLGTRSRVEVASPDGATPVGAVRVVVYSAKKPHLAQYGNFTHDFSPPYPELRMGARGWFLVGGAYRLSWRGIIN